jgi:hypothetical protein
MILSLKFNACFKPFWGHITQAVKNKFTNLAHFNIMSDN